MVDVVVNNVMSLSNTDMDYQSFLFKDPVSFSAEKYNFTRANGISHLAILPLVLSHGL